MAESVLTKESVPVPSECCGRVVRQGTVWVAVAVWTCRQGIGCEHKQCLRHLLHVVLGSCFGRLNHEGETLPHSTQLAGFHGRGGGGG